MRYDLIVEFPAYIVVNCDRDRDFRMRGQLSQVRVEDNRDAFII